MALEQKDRLTLALLYRILEKVNADGENYAAAYEALERGYTYNYPLTEGFVNVSEEEHSEDDCKEVFDIMKMYDHIHIVLDRFPKATDLKKHFKFRGFDANNDWQFSYHRYIIKTLCLFSETIPEPVNSHSMGTLGNYYRQLEAWKTLTDRYNYDLEQITLDDMFALKEQF